MIIPTGKTNIIIIPTVAINIPEHRAKRSKPVTGGATGVTLIIAHIITRNPSAKHGRVVTGGIGDV